ncbi:hypothetical protein FX988_01667 [Paraglaciecola mesophila]|uniref:Uncharacterized protein n=1 Tax=Paraglaciecola mesophila TaxID=197222 RepID=A0A857JJL7_9ALTE|nr:hypothetical protein [Paraglaciecola mesophila]QHJ11438.1 hypothetical protein FX988_01667 [Paraglaciecola mesophila]
MKLKIAVCLMLGSLSVNALGATTYHYPKSTNQYGQLDFIFVTATNGSGFCEEKKQTYSKIIAGEMFCGEDESSYNEFDWSSKTWVSKPTGSKNQCYPIFKQITCS